MNIGIINVVAVRSRLGEDFFFSSIFFISIFIPECVFFIVLFLKLYLFFAESVRSVCMPSILYKNTTMRERHCLQTNASTTYAK